MLENGYLLVHSDCLTALRQLPDNSVDSIVTDPPYGLSFMGKKWDYDVPGVDVWAECLRVLKPGGHLLAFAGTRTQHRMAVRIEDAGFEIRDMIAWLYGCLDDATEVATECGVMPYHKAKVGDRILCYDAAHGEYTYQPILEVVEYDYSDTAYRLVGDFGEQVVSRNHRVIVERGGIEVFQLAETLECEARVPVLESLPALRQAIHDAHQGAGRPQQDVQCDLRECVDRCSECRDDAAGTTQGCDDQVRGLRYERVEAGCVAAQGGNADMQQEVQRRTAWRGVGEACSHGAGALVSRVGDGAEGAHDGRVQPGLEGWVDVSQPEGNLRRSADQVRAMPCGSDGHGAGGRLCHGAPPCGGAGSWEAADASGVRASHQPRRDGQPTGEPDAVRHERTAQGIRAWGGHRSAVVRVVPFHYTGKVWCLRVPTGAFVAVRNGVAFPTGNSGFPKSLDVSKAIDKAAGVKREVVGFDPTCRLAMNRNLNDDGWQKIGQVGAPITVPATDAARQWQGWGTALKPALEPITVARKPMGGTVAANVLAHGTGALNIDACRVPVDPKADASQLRTMQRSQRSNGDGWGMSTVSGDTPQVVRSDGRWPANLIHDGSEPAAMLGEAARFFYCAKASKADRGDGNTHPTVKPTELMRYLVRLVTPPGGVVLDPFMGSGSTGKAALLEGFKFLGIDMTAEYVEIARARIQYVTGEDLC